MWSFHFSKRLNGGCLSALILGIILIAGPAMAAQDCAPGVSAAACQYRFTATDHGDAYGSLTAPLPSHSQGIRLDHGAQGVFYNNYSNSNLCRFADNNSANDYFIPQGTVAEFSNIAAHPPAGMVFSYCTLNTTSWTATAHFMNGFWTVGGPAQLPVTPSSYVTAPVNPVTTRVTNTIQPMIVILPSYIRYDCTAGTDPSSGQCTPRTIVEYQYVTLTATPNVGCGPSGATDKNQNCNGGWGNPQITYYCTVDGVNYGMGGAASCLAGYADPGSLPGCGVGGPGVLGCPPSPCGGIGVQPGNIQPDLC